MSHGVLASHGLGPSIVLWTLPAQGPHIRDFQSPGPSCIHFPEKLPPTTGTGTEQDPGPLRWAGTAGNSTGGSSINIPLTPVS